MKRRTGERMALPEIAVDQPQHLGSGASVFGDEAWASIQHSLGLSGREVQIVHAVFDDWTEADIAAKLGISPHTVHTHMERLHHKLRVKDRGALILRVVSGFLALQVDVTPLPERSGTPVRRLHQRQVSPEYCARSPDR